MDSINVVDANIVFAVHATIHPLEHSSILAVRDDHYEDTGNFPSLISTVVVRIFEIFKFSLVHLHLAVRQLNSLASLHSSCLALICVLNLCDLLQIMRIRIRIDNGQVLGNLLFSEEQKFRLVKIRFDTASVTPLKAQSYTDILNRFHFSQLERQPQVFTFTL